mgnify:CR=1 FL=1
MFPINRMRISCLIEIDRTLHSTMFPINHDSGRPAGRACVSLHSTMFPINLICLRSLRSQTTLHSTMFPINPAKAIRLPNNRKPLHSTMFPINPVLMSKSIKATSFFTFHYVSY